jgi:tetratricopeptide (TPR) repeat protein
MKKSSAPSMLGVSQSRRLLPALLLSAAALFPQASLAQFGSDSFSAGDAGTQSSSCPITGSQTDSVNSGSAPILQGATSGTIGPQAGNGTVVTGVYTSGYSITRDAFDSYPPDQAEDNAAYYQPDLEQSEYCEFSQWQTVSEDEVEREDPRLIDQPDPVDQARRDSYCRLIVEAGEKKALSSAGSDTLLNLGIAYANSDRLKDAIAALKAGIKANPNCDACLYNLATVYSNQRNYLAALKLYNKALSIRPTNRVYYHLGLTYSLLALHTQALKSFDKAVKLSASDKKSWFERALSKIALGLYSDAIADLNEALSNKHQRPSWLFQRGLALSKMKRYDEAIADFDLALKQDDSPKYYNERGKAFLQLAEYDAALYDFNEALHRDSVYAEAYENRAQVYTALGRSGPATDDVIMSKRLSTRG